MRELSELSVSASLCSTPKSFVSFVNHKRSKIDISETLTRLLALSTVVVYAWQVVMDRILKRRIDCRDCLIDVLLPAGS
jgi:hypothetical protein